MARSVELAWALAAGATALSVCLHRTPWLPSRRSGSAPSPIARHSMAIRWCRLIRSLSIGSLLGATALVGGCDPNPAPGVHLEHDAYVWQRHWTPALLDALRTSSPHIRAWRILGAETGPDGRLQPVSVDRDAVAALSNPTVLVLRISGRLGVLDANAARREGMALVDAWRQRGIAVQGVEIDHDCATARLPDYAAFLRELRRATTERGLRLSITALPTWTQSPALAGLLQTVDEAVLQVHSVMDPKEGLFDARRARAWAAAFAAVSPVPFRIALPTYGLRVERDQQGRIVAVESESPERAGGTQATELFVDPGTVAEVLETWRQRPPRGLTGLTWFRLPTREDRRAWGLATWFAVMDGRYTPPLTVADARAGDSPEVLDIRVINPTDLDTLLPRMVSVLGGGDCNAADALGIYGVARDQHAVRFRILAPGRLPPHRALIIGWVRCPRNEVHIRVDP